MVDPMPAIRSILGMPKAAPTIHLTQADQSYSGPLIFETDTRWTLEIFGQPTHFLKAAWTRKEPT